MMFHWSGGSANETAIVVLQAGLDMSHPFILSTIVIGWVIVLGAFIWNGVRLKRRLSGTSREQLFAAQSDQLGKSYREWSLPPELNFPTPRPIKSAPLGTRLSRSLPRLVSFLVIAIGSYGFLFMLLRGMSVSRMFHAFLEFLKAPQWRGWMIWPVAIYGGIAARLVVSGFIKQRKEHRLLKWGTPARAVVTASDWRGITLWTFEYSDAAGNLVRTRESRSGVPKGGSEVMTVLYDPNRPHEFISYPGARYEIGGHEMQ